MKEEKIEEKKVYAGYEPSSRHVYLVANKAMSQRTTSINPQVGARVRSS